MGVISNILGKVGYLPAQEVRQSLQTMQAEVTELRSNLTNPEQWLSDFFTGGMTAGVAVNKETALTISAVYACNRILSSSFPLP